MFNRLICLLLLLISTRAAAGIRVVGNGGGYAEMQALNAFANLKTWVGTCVSQSNPCLLSDEDAQLLRKLSAAGVFQTSRARLEFFNDPRSADVVRTEGPDKILISSRALYQIDGHTPMPFEKIAGLVLTAWLDSRNIESHSVAERLFARVHASESGWDMPEYQARGHQLELVTPGGGQTILSLELAERTIDLSALLKRKIPCAEEPSEMQVSHLAYEALVLNGRIRWNCSGHGTEAKFVMRFPNSSVDAPDGIELLWWGQQKIQSPTSTCSRLLAN